MPLFFYCELTSSFFNRWIRQDARILGVASFNGCDKAGRDLKDGCRCEDFSVGPQLEEVFRCFFRLLRDDYVRSTFRNFRRFLFRPFVLFVVRTNFINGEVRVGEDGDQDVNQGRVSVFHFLKTNYRRGSRCYRCQGSKGRSFCRGCCLFCFYGLRVRYITDRRYYYFYTRSQFTWAGESGSFLSYFLSFLFTRIAFQSSRRRNVFSFYRSVFRWEFLSFMAINGRLLPFGIFFSGYTGVDRLIRAQWAYFWQLLSNECRCLFGTFNFGCFPFKRTTIRRYWFIRPCFDYFFDGPFVAVRVFYKYRDGIRVSIPRELLMGYFFSVRRTAFVNYRTSLYPVRISLSINRAGFVSNYRTRRACAILYFLFEGFYTNLCVENVGCIRVFCLYQFVSSQDQTTDSWFSS